MTLQAFETLLNIPQATEFMWNGFDKAFVEMNGSLNPFPSPFRNATEFDSLISDLAKLKTCGSGNALTFDGTLTDGSRFHITLSPLSPAGPTLTVRRFSRRHRTLEDLASTGFLSTKMAIFLEACVRAKLNIVISGATGAGKTTLLNCLASLANGDERIITIEDVGEIQLNHQNWVRLLAVRDQQVSVRECLVGCMRMRPDRIIVGECRSSEALEMLQAMNTGHEGGMTTIHANSSEDALTRLESLILFHAGAEVPLRSLRRQIVDAIDLIIQVKKGPGGRRYIEQILEVAGTEGDVITRQPLFRMNDQFKGVTTGHPPRFVKRFERLEKLLPTGFFDPLNYEKAG